MSDKDPLTEFSEKIAGPSAELVSRIDELSQQINAYVDEKNENVDTVAVSGEFLYNVSEALEVFKGMVTLLAGLGFIEERS